MRAHSALCLIWTNKPLQPDFDATEDRQTDVGDEHGLNLIRTGLHLNRRGPHFNQAEAGKRVRNHKGYHDHTQNMISYAHKIILPSCVYEIIYDYKFCQI